MRNPLVALVAVRRFAAGSGGGSPFHSLGPDKASIRTHEGRNMDMQIFRVGSRPSVKGPEENFTGNVRIDMLFGPNEPARTSGALVTFEPGARSAWHHHPLGQYLIVTSGCGWTQCWGGPKKEIRAGDVVFCNCGRKHWHGATNTTGMSHLAIQEWLNGSPVTWLEKVSDEQYMSDVTPD